MRPRNFKASSLSKIIANAEELKIFKVKSTMLQASFMLRIRRTHLTLVILES
jgi:hypothetical protein